jgi:hypothetical protein
MNECNQNQAEIEKKRSIMLQEIKENQEME